MKKLLLLFLLIMVTGCSNNKINQNDDIKRFYLNDKYYNEGNYIKIDNNDLKKLENESYVLFTYNGYCSMTSSCEEIFKEFMEKYKIDFLSMHFEDFKKTKLYDKVKYAPSVILVENGKIKAYLDANEDDDLEYYRDSNKFANWMNNYVYFSK